MDKISIHDNLFSNEQVNKFRNLMLYTCPFKYGEVDNPYNKPTGVVCDFGEIYDSLNPEIGNVLNTLISQIYEKRKYLENFKINRIYLNLFLPQENPNFHTDGEHIVTCLYYLNPEYDLDEGGETQFILNDEIKGIRSKPGRLVIFDGSLKHRATSFRSHPRLTLAIKFHK